MPRTPTLTRLALIFHLWFLQCSPIVSTVVLTFLVCVLGTGLAVGQATTSVRGTVTDPSGKVISSNSNISTRWVEFGGPLALLLLGLICARTPAAAQTPVTTWHYDNERTSANTSETLLTLSNVNRNSFGKLFSKPVDGFIVGHPLYLPGLTMPGQGTRNVVFVATMHNSVYAFDADNANAAPLWVTSVLSYGPPGATSVPATVQKNAGVTAWTEVGIISTPVIDPTTGTLYVVAETYEGTNIVHRLHALDVTTGLEKFGGPAASEPRFTICMFSRSSRARSGPARSFRSARRRTASRRWRRRSALSMRRRTGAPPGR